MSYDPTEWAPQTPGEPPAQPPVTPPTSEQAPQPSAPPVSEQASQPQYPTQPPAFSQPAQPVPPSAPAYGQPGPASNPSLPPYGQPQTPPPGYPAPYGQPGQASSPSLPPYGQPGPASNPSLPPYGQPGQAPQTPPPGYPAQYGASADPTLAAMYPPAQYGASAAPTQAAMYPQAQYGAPVDPMVGGMYPQQAGWGEGMPPGFVPPVAPQKRGGSKVGIIVTIIILIVLLGAGGGGGYAYYLATRPKPVITISSKYLDGTTSVGAAATSFTLTGTDFTQNSVITFLLDGSALPGAPVMQSDSKGGVTATLNVTSAWAVGAHTITAKDASGYATKIGVKVEVVTPGQSNTPGPNGAPTDSANMTIAASVLLKGSSVAITLTVKNGSVCSDRDDGQPHTEHLTDSSGMAYSETIARTCSGTYQGGNLTYTETATQDKIAFANGLVCSAKVPFTDAHLTGTFSNASSISGAFSDDPVTVSCNLGVGSQTVQADTGAWTGLAVVQ